MIKKRLLAFVLFAALLIAFQPVSRVAAAPVPTVRQVIKLNPGWNAVYLDVEPLSGNPAGVFGGLPTDSSVWAWTGKNETVAQFIQDPSEPSWQSPKWLSIFLSSSQAQLNNFYKVNGNSAFLIRIPSTSSPVTLQIDGRPTIRHKQWVPDSFNLIGFDFASTPPTFASFFAPSPSHKDQAIYRLNNQSGAWEIVSNPAAAAMRPGEAFWIWCQSSSDYQGPFTVDADGADGLAFGAGLTSLRLVISNASTVDRTISVSKDVSLPAATKPVALASRKYDPAGRKILTYALPGMPPVTVKAGSSSTVTVIVQRGSFSGEAASVLEFSDTQGNRVRVPVTAVSNASASYPGLWTGTATLNAVSLVSGISGTAPNFAAGPAKPSPAELNLNLILHQDDTGQVRLLKQAVVMYKDAVLNVDGSTATPGRPVVLTRDSLIPNYSGVTLRDGAKVGRRLSAVAFDYSPSADTDFSDTALKCSGSISGIITCSLALDSSAAATAPTNPFLHRFHPDHDNLGSDYKTFKQEANRIERVITLDFDAVPRVNPDNPPPGWGVSVLGGSYTEVIKGLAKGPIRVEGNFTLNLATDVKVLNQ